MYCLLLLWICLLWLLFWIPTVKRWLVLEVFLQLVSFCVLRHLYTDAHKLWRFTHNSELEWSQALFFFNVSLLVQIHTANYTVHTSHTWFLVWYPRCSFHGRKFAFKSLFIFPLSAFFGVSEKTWFALHNGLVASFAHRSRLTARFFCFFCITTAPFSSLNYSFPFCVLYPQCFVTRVCISRCVLFWFSLSPKARPKVLCPTTVHWAALVTQF